LVGLSVERQRAIEAAVIDRIEVAPGVSGRRFDPNPLEVTWRA
jgi:hypothetical protein